MDHVGIYSAVDGHIYPLTLSKERHLGVLSAPIFLPILMSITQVTQDFTKAPRHHLPALSPFLHYHPAHRHIPTPTYSYVYVFSIKFLGGYYNCVAVRLYVCLYVHVCVCFML